MKKYLLLILLITPTFHFTFSQTIIRFLPNELSKNENIQHKQIGKIEQNGISFEGKLDIELPDRTLKLNLVRSSIKQYKTITTSAGEISSNVEIYEDCSRNQKCFIATTNNRFYSIYILENEKFTSLENTKIEQATYIKNGSIDKAISEKIRIDVDINKAVSLSQKNKRNRTVSGCSEFPIAFICDYAHFQNNILKKSIAEIEADNLLRLAATQELFSDYAFDAKIYFKAIGQIIYDKPGETPWEYEELDVPLGRLASAIEFTKKPSSWEKQKLLTYIIITGLDYGDQTIWGVGRSSLKEFEMGTAVIKGFKSQSQTLWLLTHELGHVFGASHVDVGSIMFPFFDGYGLNWSSKSKAEINTTLNDLNDKKWLKICPKLQLSWDIEEDSLTLFYETNYEAIDDVFTIEFSSDNSKTWQKITEVKSKNAYKYQLRVPATKVYLSGIPIRIRQTGTNEITSNTINVVVTALEERPPLSKSLVYIKNNSNELIINSLTPSKVLVFDVFGKKICQMESTKNEYSIDVKVWNRGIYFVKILSNPSRVYKVFKEN
ncbi:MAG: T9SS type A sorting domain-containing protein [Bacteroidota bacterium]